MTASKKEIFERVHGKSDDSKAPEAPQQKADRASKSPNLVSDLQAAEPLLSGDTASIQRALSRHNDEAIAWRNDLVEQASDALAEVLDPFGIQADILNATTQKVRDRVGGHQATPFTQLLGAPQFKRLERPALPQQNAPLLP